MKQLSNFEHFTIIKEAEEKLEQYLDSLYESLYSEELNEAEAGKAKTKLGAALGSPIKFIKIKNNAKKYQQVLVQKALNNVDYEKKKQAAGGTVDKDKAEVLKAANAAKNQALTDKATAIADRMKDLATSPGLQKVKTLAISKARVAAAETALKGADAEETKQLKVKIKELNAKAADAEQAIKDYEKEGADQQQQTQQEAPQQQEGPKVKDDAKADAKVDNTEKIAALDSKIEGLKNDKKNKEDQLNSKNHPDVLAVEVAIKTAELQKAELGENKDAIESAKAALQTAQDDKKAAVDNLKNDDQTEGGSDPIASLEKDIADFDKNIETEMATVAQLKKDLEQAKRDVSTGRGSDAEVLKIQKKLDDSNEDLAELKRRKADAKKKISSLQKESVTYLSESVADKFRYLMAERLK